MAKKFFVVGSINMDLSATVERFPVPGETVLGNSFFTSPGGKGGNQACALGRLGADVNMVGKIGDDQFGREYLKHFEHEGIHIGHIETISAVSTGIAVIEVALNGENRIVIIPGANAEVDTKQVDRVAGEFDTDSIVLLQLEIPIPTVLYTLKAAKARGAVTILDPAPAVKLPEELFQYVDYLTPNTTEMAVVSEMDTGEEKQLQAAASKMLDRGVGTLIVKQGARGADIFNGASAEHIPGFAVKAVDTTAAGDSFNAGFAYGLGRGYDVPESVRFAHAVAALSTEKMGAQTAMPTIEEVGRLYS